MTEDLSGTVVGKAPASGDDERELLLRCAQVMRRVRTHELDERDVVYAIADVLDRANFILESSTELTILAGAEGTFVNGHPHDLAPTHPEAAEELVTGLPARSLAGIRVTSSIDQVELRAFLSAWRLATSGSPKASLARMREVMEGERAGHGLPEPGPIVLVLLPADGKLPLPAVVTPLPPESSLDDDAPYVAPEEDDVERAGLAKLAQRKTADAPPPAQPPAKPVDAERAALAELAAKPRAATPEDPADARVSRTMVKKSGDVIAEDVTAVEKARRSDELVAKSKSSDRLASASPSKSSVTKSGPSKSNDDWLTRGDSKTKGSSWLKGDSSIKGDSAVKRASSWLDDAADTEEAPEADAPSAEDEYKSAFAQLASSAAAPEAEAPAAAPTEAPAAPPTGAPAEAAPDPEVERKASSTAVRPATEVIGEDLAERAPEAEPVTSVDAEGVERTASGTAIGRVTPRVAEQAPADVDPTKTPVRLEAPGPTSVDDLSPESSRATLVYSRLCSRAGRALAAPAADRDRAAAAVRRSIVEMLNGLAHTAFEDRLLALTAFPVEPAESRARHAANTAIFTAFAGRACGMQPLPLCDLLVAAALHDDGDIEREGKPDRWPRTLSRILESTSISDATLLRVVLSYERAGPRGVLARPTPRSKRPRLEARIVACACAFDDALTGAPDRAGARPDLALERLGPAGHDPVAVKAIAAGLGAYPRGVLVRVAPHGQLGVVLACGGRRGNRPRVRIFADSSNQVIPVKEVELTNATELTIERIEDPTSLQVDAPAHLVAWG
jgi:hypothetical protein